MKVFSRFFVFALLGLCLIFLASCSMDVQPKAGKSKAMTTGLVRYSVSPIASGDEEASALVAGTGSDSSRTISLNGSGVPQFTFTNSDKLSVFSTSAYMTASFVESRPDDGEWNIARFQGAGFALSDGTAYYSLLPASSDATDTYDQVRIHYAKQVQNGNNSISHLSAFDYNYAESVWNEGALSFQYTRLPAILKLVLTLPEACSVSNVFIESSASNIVTGGALDISTGTFTPASSNMVNLAFSSPVAVAAGNTVTAYIAVGEGSLAGDTTTFRISAATSNGVYISAALNGRPAGSPMTAGNYYTIAATLQKVERNAYGDAEKLFAAVGLGQWNGQHPYFNKSSQGQQTSIYARVKGANVDNAALAVSPAYMNPQTVLTGAHAMYNNNLDAYVIAGSVIDFIPVPADTTLSVDYSSTSAGVGIQIFKTSYTRLNSDNTKAKAAGKYNFGSTSRFYLLEDNLDGTRTLKYSNMEGETVYAAFVVYEGNPAFDSVFPNGGYTLLETPDAPLGTTVSCVASYESATLEHSGFGCSLDVYSDAECTILLESSPWGNGSSEYLNTTGHNVYVKAHLRDLEDYSKDVSSAYSSATVSVRGAYASSNEILEGVVEAGSVFSVHSLLASDHLQIVLYSDSGYTNHVASSDLAQDGAYAYWYNNTGSDCYAKVVVLNDSSDPYDSANILWEDLTDVDNTFYVSGSMGTLGVPAGATVDLGWDSSAVNCYLSVDGGATVDLSTTGGSWTNESGDVAQVTIVYRLRSSQKASMAMAKIHGTISYDDAEHTVEIIGAFANDVKYSENSGNVTLSAYETQNASSGYRYPLITYGTYPDYPAGIVSMGSFGYDGLTVPAAGSGEERHVTISWNGTKTEMKCNVKIVSKTKGSVIYYGSFGDLNSTNSVSSVTYDLTEADGECYVFVQFNYPPHNYPLVAFPKVVYTTSTL